MADTIFVDGIGAIVIKVEFYSVSSSIDALKNDSNLNILSFKNQASLNLL